MSTEESRGGGFIVRVLQKHVIGEPEGEIIREIACVLTLVDQLQAELNASTPMLGGRLNPVVVELRQQRMLLAKLVSLLPPAEDVGVPPPPETPRTRQARRAANVRWAEHRRIRGAFDA